MNGKIPLTGSPKESQDMGIKESKMMQVLNQNCYHTRSYITNGMLKLIVIHIHTEENIFTEPVKRTLFCSLLHHEIRSIASSMTTELPRTTTIPMLFRSPVFLISTVASTTRFMKGSKPRRVPSTWRPPFNLRQICDKNDSY